ncbi:hypothetical protein ABVN80_06130 [Acinetobacter baumannii]
MQRVDPKAVAAMVDASKESLGAPAPQATKSAKKRNLPRKKQPLLQQLVKLKLLVLKTS